MLACLMRLREYIYPYLLDSQDNRVFYIKKRDNRVFYIKKERE